MPEPMYTTADVMRLLVLKDPETIHAIGKAGKIRGVKFGNQWRWNRESVDGFIAGEPVAPVLARKSPVRRSVMKVPDFFASRGL